MSTNDQNEVVDQEEVIEQQVDGNESTLENEDITGQEGENDEVVTLRKQLDEANNRILRVQADYDNFRRRTVKEKEDLAKYASVKLIEQLLPSVDNFGRAITAANASGDYESLAKGIDMIFRGLMSTMEAEGLQVMNTVGTPFNPEYHQAVMTIETDEYEEGIVVEELQSGYTLKDKVIRPAMVKVSG